MAQILIRGLADEDIKRLRQHADDNQRSLEAEARSALRDAARRPTREDREQFIKFADRMRKSLQGKVKGDSVDLLREGREGRAAS
jgi:plasmid stability protein